MPNSPLQLAFLFLLAVSIQASNYSVTVRIINNSSYTLLRNHSDAHYGKWQKNPPYRVYPFSENTFKIDPKNDFSGAEACLNYSVVIGHNQEWFQQSDESWVFFNFTSSVLDPSQINYETSKNGIMPVRFYTGKNFVNDSLVTNTWIDEWHQDGVEDEVKPLTIEITLNQNLITTTEFYWLYQPYDDSRFAWDQVDFIQNIIWQHWGNESLFWEERVLAPTTMLEPQYNCIAWGLGTSGKWRRPPIDYETAITQNYWGEPRWVQVDNYTDADAALYCEIHRVINGTRCKSRYVHAALRIPNWLNTSKSTWSSKFGSGPLVTHETPFTITGGPGLSYGTPIVFFKEVGRYENGGWEPTPIIVTNESARTLLKDVYSRTDRRVKAKFEELYEQWNNDHREKSRSDLNDYATGKGWDRLLEFCQNEPAAVQLLLHEGMKGDIMVSVLLDQILPLKNFIPDVQDSISLQINHWENKTLEEEKVHPWKMNDKLMFTKLKYCLPETSRNQFQSLVQNWKQAKTTEGDEWSRLYHFIKTHDARALVLDHTANKDETLLERLRKMNDLHDHHLYADMLSGDMGTVIENMRKSKVQICKRAMRRSSVVRRKVARKANRSI